MDDKGSVSSWNSSVASWAGNIKDKAHRPSSSEAEKIREKSEDENTDGSLQSDAAEFSMLSTANMKQHDLEMNLMRANDLPAKSSRKKRRRRRRGKKKVKLPLVESLVGRNFPLPSPMEIDMYARGSDAVRLLPRALMSSGSSFLDSDKSQ